MAYFPQHTRTRSPRVRIPNDEQVRFNIGGHFVPATLQKISMTGGLAEFKAGGSQSGLAEIHLTTISGPVRGLVEFLARQKRQSSQARAFRFIALSNADFNRLNSTLRIMRQKGLGEPGK